MLSNTEAMTEKERVKAERTAILDSILTRAADRLGDLREPVMQHYYRRFPEALALFEEHGLNNRQKLEGEMIESVLYCIMSWIENPAEVAIVLFSTVPHHGDTLKVPVRCFTGLIDTAIDQIAATIPPEASAEAALLAEIRDSLRKETADAADYYHLT